MGFGQKINLWLRSGGEVTRIWKWCLVIFVVGILFSTIIPPLAPFSGFVMALALVGSILATLILGLGAADKAKRRREEIERLQVKDEFEAKKGEGR